MNRDDIIRMARETDQECNCDRDMYEWLEWFAQLVSAAERKAMIEQGWRQCAKDQRTTQFCGMVEQAVQAEREACAKVCDANKHYFGYQCAEAIRERGNQ